MSKGKGKKIRQYEKILLLLIHAKGAAVTMDEIKQTLGTELEVYKMPTYLWELKKYGAVVEKTKNGRNIVSLTLKNIDEMTVYAQSRGFIAPPAVVLNPEDLMVTQ